MNKNKGFTLVELMVVISIISILAASAMAMYPNYVDRTRLGGEMSQLSAATNAVMESLMTQGTVPSTANGADVDDTATTFLQQPQGNADATFGQIVFASKTVSGATIYLSPYQSGASVIDSTAQLHPTEIIRWECVITGVTASQIPSECTAVDAA